MNSVHILVCDSLSEEGLKLLRDGGFKLDIKTGLNEADLIKIIGNYEGVLVRSATKLTEKVLKAGTKLKLIGRAGIGIDNIDLVAASRLGILVMNTPDANAVTTAELAISMLLSLARRIPQADRSMRAGKWERDLFTGTEVTAKTLGIAGFGRIGRLVAERGLGLKMRVLGFDPLLNPKESPMPAVSLVDFDTLLRESDFISIHAPLNEGTKNLFDKKAFAKMKPTAKLINCARGGIINEKDLLEALSSGKLAGAALDVYEKEPPKGSPLLGLENAVFTPHLGASTDEAQFRVSVDIAEQLLAYFRTGEIRNALNAATLSAEISETLRPFVVLGEKLGSFLAQTLDFPIRKIEIHYRGELHQHSLGPVRSAILVGMIRPTLDGPVNQVNAPLIVAERGIQVIEMREARSRDYLNLISVEAKGEKKDQVGQVAGTVFGSQPRFVQVNGFQLDAQPQGDLLVTSHLDRPGMIGKIGTVLGSQQVNISRLQLGSSETGDGKAIAILNIDSPISKEALEELRRIPNILEARYVRL